MKPKKYMFKTLKKDVFSLEKFLSGLLWFVRATRG